MREAGDDLMCFYASSRPSLVQCGGSTRNGSTLCRAAGRVQVSGGTGRAEATIWRGSTINSNDRRNAEAASWTRRRREGARRLLAGRACTDLSHGPGSWAGCCVRERGGEEGGHTGNSEWMREEGKEDVGEATYSKLGLLWL